MAPVRENNSREGKAASGGGGWILVANEGVALKKMEQPRKINQAGGR